MIHNPQLLSHSLNCLHPAGRDGLHQTGVVLFGLVTIGFGPLNERLVKHRRLSAITGESGGVASARMSPGQQSSARLGIEVETTRR